MKRSLVITLLLVAQALQAQTYTPKSIRLEGVPEADRAAVMQQLALPQNAPVTKQQIEAALDRLGSTGSYTDLSYTVNSEALVIQVNGAAGTSQALPAIFTNFPWWQPGQLLPLVEAKVPLFHGELPLKGTLTDQVEAALVSLLAEKGVPNARVEASLATAAGAGIGGIALTIVEPRILIGTVRAPGTGTAAEAQMQNVIAHLNGEEYETAQSLRTVRLNTLDTQRNAAYLDAVVEEPIASPPQKHGADYVVDITATVHAGELFHVASIEFDPLPPGEGIPTIEKLREAIEIKRGDLAGEMKLTIGEGLAERVFQSQGLLEAKATAVISKDEAAHTVSYRFSSAPGPIYRVAEIDLSALPPGLAARLQKEINVKPGQIANSDVTKEIEQALRAEGLSQKVSLTQQQQRATHTAVYVIRPR